MVFFFSRQFRLVLFQALRALGLFQCNFQKRNDNHGKFGTQINVVRLIVIYGTPFNVKGTPFNVSPSQQDEALCIV